MHSDDRDELVEEQLRHLLEVLRGGRGAGGAARGGGGGRGQEGILGHATRSRGAPPSKNALRLSIARMPMATRVSWVALPRCGSRTTCSMVRRSGVTWGSFSYTSSAAPAICLPLSAVTSAASSTMSPRAVLIRNAVGFMSAIRRALDRKSTRLNSSHLVISYAVFCLKKKSNIMCSINPHEREFYPQARRAGRS